MSYASLGDLKSALRITDNDSDGLLQVALDAAAAAIDEHCGRTFVADANASTRVYEPSHHRQNAGLNDPYMMSNRVVTDDFYTAAGLIIAVNGTALAAAVPNVSGGYVLTPENAPAKGEPYTGFYWYSTYSVLPWIWGVGQRANVSVTAKWGYAAAVPPAVNMANLLQASRWYARRNSPYGIAGSLELGSELRLLAKLDPDVAVMLAGKVRY